MQEYYHVAKNADEGQDRPSKVKLRNKTAELEEPKTDPTSNHLCHIATKSGSLRPYWLRVEEFHLKIVSDKSDSVKAKYHLLDVIITVEEKIPRESA
jgi:hypothetical protein